MNQARTISLQLITLINIKKMDNFDLRKYLIENKATANSRVLTEAKTYAVDPKGDEYLDFIDVVNAYLMVSEDDLLENPVDFEDIAALIGKYGKLLFEVEIVGLDDTVDGIESYYSVTNQEVLNKIAQIYAQDEIHYDLAAAIQQGETTGFMMFIGEFSGVFVVIPLEPGFEKIEIEAQQHVKH